MDGPSEPDRITRSVLDHLKGVLREGDPAAPAAPPGPARRLGRYEILSELGQGGAGVVYRAHDPELRRIVALKRISRIPTESEKARFLREARTAAQLRHPNIVGIYDIGEAEGQTYIAMELVEGAPLDQAAAGLPRRRRLEIVRDVARALQAAHERGIAHRDIKPGNIVIRPDGQPVVLDFGLAKDVEPESRVTATGAVVGTPAYLSPEQALGHPGHVDTRTDLYSLGVVLYELVTGRLPHGETTLYGQVKAILEREPPSPSSIDRSVGRDLEAIILKALEKDKRYRYPTAAALAGDLDALLRGDPVGVRGGKALRWLRRRRKALALAGAAVAAAAAIVVFVRPADRPAALPAGEPGEADRLTANAEGEILKAIEAVRKGKAKRIQEPLLKAAEARLEEALKSFDGLARPYLVLAKSQSFRGAHAEALATLARMRRKVATVPEEQALVQEAHERVMLFAVEALPSADGFDLGRLRAQEGFAEFLQRLGKGPGRAAAIRPALEKAASGPPREAFAAARQLAAEEGDLESVPCVGHPLTALLAHGSNEMPRPPGPGAGCDKVIRMAAAIPGGRRSQAAAQQKALQEVIASEIVAPAGACYLLAHFDLSDDKADEAIRHAALARPAADQKYALEYFQGVCTLTRDPRRAAGHFERAAQLRPNLDEARYHLAAALAVQAGGRAAGEERDRLLGRALEILKEIAPRAKGAAGPDAPAPFDRTLLRFKLSIRTLQADPLLEPIRSHPRWGPELRRLGGR
jgi:predicted Ser/Thr protein kinase/tetratricopeptide (TPR) repeat protein